MKKLTKAMIDVHNERIRQIKKEGYDTAHDDAHTAGEIAMAAAWYAAPEEIFIKSQNRDRITFSHAIPRDWSLEKKNMRRDLVRAGALIIAEIERLDRAKP